MRPNLLWNGVGVLALSMTLACDKPGEGSSDSGSTDTGDSGDTGSGTGPDDSCDDGCAEGLVCSRGECIDPCMGEEGARCGPGRVPCAEGLQCLSVPGLQAQLCQRPPAEGEVCNQGVCAEGLICDWTRAPAICGVGPAAGDPCPNGLCGVNEYCDFQQQPSVCVARVGAGEPCGNAGGDSCVADHVCWDASGAEATCQPVPQAEGERCVGWRCGPGLICRETDEVCVSPPLVEGEPCVDGVCGAGLVCDWNEENGICRTPPREPGDRCVSEWCEPEGLECDTSQEPPTCVPTPSEEGARCFGRCVEPLYCAEGEAGAAVCQSAPDTAGDPCLLGWLCGAGLVCNWENETCVRAPAEGEDCGNFGCEQAHECQWDETTQTQVCRGMPVEGEPCPLGRCADGAWCDQGTDPMAPVCRAIGENGEPCMGHAHCISGHCPRGFCQPVPDREGDPCPAGFCAGGLSCQNQVCVQVDICG